MKLHDLLDDIADSKSKVRILRVLFRFPGREFTEREMARMIGMSPNTVNLALNDLRRTNLFLYKRLGRTHAYRCNPESVLFSPLADLFKAESHVWEGMLDYLRDELKGIGTCILFGSFARSEEGFDSDLDLLVVTGARHEAESRLARISDALLSGYSVTLAPIIMTHSEFEGKKQKGFIREALSDGMMLVEER
jgi:predicted nucleotidyltransferase